MTLVDKDELYMDCEELAETKEDCLEYIRLAPEVNFNAEVNYMYEKKAFGIVFDVLKNTASKEDYNAIRTALFDYAKHSNTELLVMIMKNKYDK